MSVGGKQRNIATRHTIFVPKFPDVRMFANHVCPGRRCEGVCGSTGGQASCEGVWWSLDAEDVLVGCHFKVLLRQGKSESEGMESLLIVLHKDTYLWDRTAGGGVYVAYETDGAAEGDREAVGGREGIFFFIVPTRQEQRGSLRKLHRVR